VLGQRIQRGAISKGHESGKGLAALMRTESPRSAAIGRHLQPARESVDSGVCALTLGDAQPQDAIGKPLINTEVPNTRALPEVRCAAAGGGLEAYR